MKRSDGEIAEIEALYRRHGAALVLFAVTVLGDRPRAQDVVHQVFLKLIENPILAGVQEKKAYLYACVRNAAVNEIRLRDRTEPLDTDFPWFVAPGQDRVEEQSLRRALATLPVEQRQIVVLHVWGELTFAQVGELLEISSNTAASRYRYALNKLRETMFAKENSCANS